MINLLRFSPYNEKNIYFNVISIPLIIKNNVSNIRMHIWSTNTKEKI